MGWLREMTSLIRQYRQASKNYRASMRRLYRANPNISKRDLRQAVRESAVE
jgi:hypothetical protein